MKENTDEKRIIPVNENSVFYKIQIFFKSLFNKGFRKKGSDLSLTMSDEASDIKENKDAKETFSEYIKNIEDDETRLIKLQKKYRSQEIAEEDLTEKQINSLCDLYDKQIECLKKSNEIRVGKILDCRKRMQTDS